MSNLTNDLDSLVDKPFISPNKCKVWILCQSLKPDEAAKFIELIEKTSVSGAAISKVLYAHGYDVSSAIVNRHRRRKSGSGCTCQ